MQQQKNIVENSTDQRGLLSKALWAQLWKGLLARLQAGEVMTTNEHFYWALADDYTKYTGGEPSEDVLLQMQKMVVEINAKHPETYLIQGIQNGVKKAFEDGIRKLHWDVEKIQALGTSSIRRFCEHGEVHEMLEEFNLQPDQLDLVDCIAGILHDLATAKPDAEEIGVAKGHQIAGKQGHIDSAKMAAINAPNILPNPATEESPVPNSQPPPSPATSQAELKAAVASGEVDQGELNQRNSQQERLHKEIAKREAGRVDENIDGYVEMGILNEEEAGQLRALQEVEDKLKRGEISEQDADHIRNSILKGDARSELERKVREAVDHAVIYLQVYQAMQRIGTQYDEPLAYLIRNKEMVTAQKPSPESVSEMMQVLMDDVPTLEGLIDIMERKDQEIRMLSVRLPPYNAIASRGLERIGNMIIEEDFVAELRQMDEERMSSRLNSADKMVRVRPAADMRCFISLIDHLTKRTPFRKQVRLLRVNMTLEQFFRDSSDLNQARHQAESFLERRLRRLFPDMSTDEGNEIKMRGAKMIDDIEQRILTERQQAVEAKRAKKAEASPQKQAPPPASGGNEELELTEEERQKGVQIGRVESRVGGGMRKIPLKIMPDEDDPSYFVIVQRDPETGELSPQMRRGQKRLVEKGRDGTWRPVKG